MTTGDGRVMNVDFTTPPIDDQGKDDVAKGALAMQKSTLRLGHEFSDRVRMSRRRWLAAVGAAVAATTLSDVPVLARQATPVAAPMASPVAVDRDWRGERWVGTWSAAPQTPFPAFEDFPSQLIELDNQTVRQIVRIVAGGDQVRVRLTNAYGDAPLVIGAAHIALREAETRIDPATDRTLTFSGSPSFTIPAGATALSDPVDMVVPALTELAISIFLPEPSPSTTVHGFAFQTNFISPGGDFTAASEMPVEASPQSWMFLSGVDVLVSQPTGVVVAFGDSITDGAFSTLDANRRWPDVLAERLAADPPGRAMTVLNQGISGNRLLHDEAGELGLAFGQNALARLDRDVLSQPGVTHLIVLEGINDIGLPAAFAASEQAVTADELIGALRQLVERAHEREIAVFGGTILPFEGTEMYFSAEGEVTRQTVNEWIRTGGAFDAVIDFDAAVRDPSQTTRLLPMFDSGDHLHPNDAGLRAMGEAIDLSVFQSGGGA
ncbi:MAG: SGNH/GDSL hydrolase family protein [Chloroflexota bacterium]|nr:SGNH/GDSL hydrolase family protein [Chloroflexota bacterium]